MSGANQKHKLALSLLGIGAIVYARCTMEHWLQKKKRRYAIKTKPDRKNDSSLHECQRYTLLARLPCPGTGHLRKKDTLFK
jgi:hypothetical protein